MRSPEFSIVVVLPSEKHLDGIVILCAGGAILWIQAEGTDAPCCKIAFSRSPHQVLSFPGASLWLITMVPTLLSRESMFSSGQEEGKGTGCVALERSPGHTGSRQLDRGAHG